MKNIWGEGGNEGEKRGGYVYICVGVPVFLCLHCIGEYCPHLHLFNIYLDISYKKFEFCLSSRQYF